MRGNSYTVERFRHGTGDEAWVARASLGDDDLSLTMSAYGANALAAKRALSTKIANLNRALADLDSSLMNK